VGEGPLTGRGDQRLEQPQEALRLESVGFAICLRDLYE
jgi:hypothetical protein